MKKSSKVIIAVLAAIICVAGFALRDFIIPKTWNYKITIEIETPEGIKSGSAVRQVTGRRELAGYLGAGVVIFDVKGEAAIVDLGKRGILLELPTHDVLRKAFPYSQNITIIDYYAANLVVGKSAQLDKRNFITFTDIDDPKSIRTVASDDLNKFFGDGVKLKSITIEITDDDVTWGQVRHYLSWYDIKRMGLTFKEIKENNRLKKDMDQAQFFTKESLMKGE